MATEQDNGQAVGVAVGTPGREDGDNGDLIPGQCHITMVAVRPEHWGHGLGSRLVRALLEEIRTRAYTSAQLFTHADNTRAHRLYTRLGFQPTGQTGISQHGEPIIR